MSCLLPIRYINLERDQERRERLDAEGLRLGLALERFPAVLWTALPAAEQDRLYSAPLNARQFHQPLVNGEKGCYASHLALWQWLLDSDHPALVVLEDDVRLEKDFAAVCNAIADLPPGWDMVKLLGRESLGQREKLRRRRALCPGFELIDYRRVPSLTAGYVISRAGAAKLLARRLPFGRPIDVDLRHWWECESLRVQGVRPGVLSLDDTSLTSTMGDKKAGQDWRRRWKKFRNKFRYSLANAWYSR